MPRHRDPPKRPAEKVRRARLALVRNRQRTIRLEETLYLAAYEANRAGWSQRALAEALGEAHTTVQNWIEVGERIHQRSAQHEE